MHDADYITSVSCAYKSHDTYVRVTCVIKTTIYRLLYIVLISRILQAVPNFFPVPQAKWVSLALIVFAVSYN